MLPPQQYAWSATLSHRDMSRTELHREVVALPDDVSLA